MANIDKSRVMAQAKTMLDQNVPIETISNQLGLDRNTLNNLLMQNSLMPESVMQPDDYRNSYGAGITGNQLNDPTTQVIIDGMTSGEGEGADIKEFLDVNLGANTGEDDDLTTDQAITSGSVAGVMGDQDSFMSYLEGASMLEGLTDPEKMEIYKRAATDMVGEMDYDEFIQQPDKVMPYLAAGLSLINSGEKGEDWGAALGKAFISGYGSKRKEGLPLAPSNPLFQPFTSAERSQIAPAIREDNGLTKRASTKRFNKVFGQVGENLQDQYSTIKELERISKLVGNTKDEEEDIDEILDSANDEDIKGYGMASFDPGAFN